MAKVWLVATAMHIPLLCVVRTWCAMKVPPEHTYGKDKVFNDISIDKGVDNFDKNVPMASFYSYQLQVSLLPNEKINDEYAEMLALAVSYDGQLQTLELQSNPIGREGARKLAKAIQESTVLEKLTVAKYPTDRTLQLEKALVQVCRGTTEDPLDLSEAEFEDFGIHFLAGMLEENEKLKLKTLTLTKLKLKTDEDVDRRAEAEDLEAAPVPMTEASAKKKSAGSQSLSSLITALKENRTLEELYVAKYKAEKAAMMVHVCRGRTDELDLSETEDMTGFGVHFCLGLLHESSLQMKKLTLNKCKIEDNGAVSLAGALTHSRWLETLELAENEISDKGAKELAVSLRQNPTLKKLLLNDNKIGDDGAKSLADALTRHNTKLESLNLHGNPIGKIGAECLAETVKKSPKLNKFFVANDEALVRALKEDEEINLSGTKMAEFDVYFLAAMLKANCMVKKLRLFNNDIGNDGARADNNEHGNDGACDGAIALVEALRESNVGELFVAKHDAEKAELLAQVCRATAGSEKPTQENSMKEETNTGEFFAMADQVRGTISQQLSKITGDTGQKADKENEIKLDLNRTEDMGNFGVNFLAAILHKNLTLTELLLGKCSLNDEGARILAHAVKGNNRLRTLSLFSNDIGSDGAAHLATALCGNNELKELFLQQNKMGDEGAKEMAKALECNGTLELLWLGENGIGDGGAKSLADALKKNTPLLELSLYNNNIKDKGASDLAGALKKNRNLQTLKLDYNSIQKDGAKSLAEALERNGKLANLTLFNNNISDASSKKIKEAWGARVGELILPVGDD